MGIKRNSEQTRDKQRHFLSHSNPSVLLSDILLQGFPAHGRA
jgi:hypothetical protein